MKLLYYPGTDSLYIELQPQPGEELFVELRNVKVFADDYSI